MKQIIKTKLNTKNKFENEKLYDIIKLWENMMKN